MSVNYEAFARRLKTLRNSAGRSQQEMGKICGIGQYYGNIEREQERPAEATIIRIAEALGIDPDWLMHGTGQSPDAKDLDALRSENIPTALPEKESKTQPDSSTHDIQEVKPVPVKLPEAIKPVADYEKIMKASSILETHEPEPQNLSVLIEECDIKIMHSIGSMLIVRILPNDLKPIRIDVMGFTLTLSELQGLGEMMLAAHKKAQEVLA